jgi:EAL domain-containing protein (putative c-di-GMP-specific phosphodiesterase class I)/CHASE3 domain sensor protein
VTPHNRVLIVVGGTALIVCLTIAGIFVQTDLAGANLRRDVETAIALESLGDALLSDVQTQRRSIDQYLMTADKRALDRYRQAMADETRTAARIRDGAGNLSGVTDALARVGSEDRAWRATVADPAIAAVSGGSVEAVRAAVDTVIRDSKSTETAINEFRLEITAEGAELRGRADLLNRLRGAATGVGILVELLAAGLSLWFVRRYGLRVSREAGRRVQASAERVAIVASLRTLRTQETPDATAALIAEALHRLPGVDVASVFEITGDTVTALAIVGLPDFPIQTGDVLPDAQARNMRVLSANGAWSKRWVRGAEATPYTERLAAIGMKCWAVAPIQANGALIGLVGLATTNEEHARHIVEDLPAVTEFASVAETILAPALVARREGAQRRQQMAAMISAAAFRPVFQPIVDLSTGATVGFEALTRFDDGSRPDLTFAAAVECGMGMELETMTMEAALREARHLTPGAWLSLNISPALLAESSALGRVLADRARPVVLEITEHEAIEAYAPLREAMARLGPGVRLAVDDAGAGVANFNHLVELRPNFVKIDIGLVRGVDADPSRQAMVAGLIHFAVRAGCEVIAEGIETEAERATVAELGVTLGQGYLLARPAPAETWSIPIEQPDAIAQMLPSVPRRSRRPASLASVADLARPQPKPELRGAYPNSTTMPNIA